MKQKCVWQLLFGFFLLLAAGCGPSAAQQNQAPGTLPLPGPVFPDYQVKTLDNQPQSLQAYRGKIVILDLFATWCPPCRLIIPHFVELQHAYPDTLQVIGLCYDQSPATDVKEFIQRMKINYPVFWGTEEIADHVNLRGIPTMLLLDQQGRVIQTYIGYTPKSVFEKAIQALLKNPEPKP